LIISGTHGFVVAALANLRGDAEPAHAGRRTPSPFVHLDLVGGACLLLFGLGWIRPIQIEPDQLRSPRRDLILIGAAGLASVLLVGYLSYQLRSLAVAALPSGPGIAVAATLQTTATLAISFCLFNLL